MRGKWDGVNNLRPKNKESEVRVPCSSSKRSRSGVRAMMLRMAWKKLRWMRGKVLTRYTAKRPKDYQQEYEL